MPDPWKEEEKIEIVGSGLRATIVPARGGKIVSLMDRTGREWLAQPVTPVAPPARRGTLFTRAEMAGWDECAPSITACTVNGVELPDHGELWTEVFDVVGVTTTARGRSFDYQFERCVEPTATGLRLSYRAEARRDRVPFLWAAHPQFVSPAGSKVRLRDDVKTVVDVMSTQPRPLPWGRELATIDTVPYGRSRKIYVDPDNPVFDAVLVRPDGAELRLSWSHECAYLGIWFDRCAYSRAPVIALEPCTGYFDSLETAINANRVTVLEPGRALEWWIDLEVSQRPGSTNSLPSFRGDPLGGVVM